MKKKYKKSCIELQEKYHTNCLFKNILRKGRGLSFDFDNNGRLKGSFFCHKKYQGYDNRIHGGIMAVIIDESMVHCLMGHGVVGVTTNLSIKYRLPVFIEDNVVIETVISANRLDGKLYDMKTEVIQKNKTAITAKGNFYKVN